MNAFDKHSKNITAWCELCDQVFDALSAADTHKIETTHEVRIIEFWISHRN
jgi:hypothetical protein